MVESELRELLVELYITHGDREFSMEYISKSYTYRLLGVMEWVNPFETDTLLKLTPKALAFIKEGSV